MFLQGAQSSLTFTDSLTVSLVSSGFRLSSFVHSAELKCHMSAVISPRS